MSENVFIIAEAGVNHNGELGRALELVDAAARARADAVKFQSFRAEKLAASTAGLAEYQKRSASGSQVEMLRALELGHEAHRVLQARCAEQGIEFLSSPFDLESVDFLAGLGMSRFKIPSGEITNLPYLRRIGALGLPVILSTGMSTLDEVRAALAALAAAGTPAERVTLLHCTTAYPTPFADVNLRAMRTLAEHFPHCPVGYSDHTTGIAVPTAAVALGARIIEKHFTLDRELPGPDHRASLEPDELAAMVEAIRSVEAALGTGRKEPAGSETGNMAIARKHVVAGRVINAGEPFTGENLDVKRTGRPGVSPMRWDELLGRRALRGYAPDEPLDPCEVCEVDR